MNRIPVIDMTLTGRTIGRLRREAGMTVRQLQAFFGFSTPQAIYKWQRGDPMPTLDNIVALAFVFGVTVEDILVFQDSAPVRVIA